MIKILIRHQLLEICINTFFDRVTANFTQPPIIKNWLTEEDHVVEFTYVDGRPIAHFESKDLRLYDAITGDYVQYNMNDVKSAGGEFNEQSWHTLDDLIVDDIESMMDQTEDDIFS